MKIRADGSAEESEGRVRVGDEGDRQMEAKRKRVLFSRRAQEQTQWVVECQTNGGKEKEDVIH